MNLICGVNPVLEALAAGTRHFDRLLVVKGLRGRRLPEAIRRATRLGIPLRFEMRETLDRMAGGVPHQGIIAIVSEKPVLSLPALLDAVKSPALLVVLDGVEDPRNLGAILRTAEAAGADGVLLPERHSAGLSETVARASAGALEHVPVARVGNLVQALQALKERGVWIVGYDAAGTERWDAVDLTKPVALVLGGEGRGMRRLVREHCDHLVSIPHFGHVTSLNVSVAAGVALYEAVRQRRAVPSVVRPIPARPSHQIVGPGPDDDLGEDGGNGAYDEGRHAHEGAAEAEDAFFGRAVPHLDFHEEVAWGRGPTVLKAIDFHTARRPGDRDRSRRGKGKRGRPRPPGGPPRGPEPRAERGDRVEAAAGSDEAAVEARQPDGGGRAEETAPAVVARAEKTGGAEASPPGRRHRRRRRGRRNGAPADAPRREEGAPASGVPGLREPGGQREHDAAPRGEGVGPRGESGSPQGEGAAGENGGGPRPGRRRRRRRRH
jgi:23S rRNA (guanosine2251-2'-O)-methyltransferase